MKNKKLEAQMIELAKINKLDCVNKICDSIIPELLASLALAMHNTQGMERDQILTILTEMTDIWQDYQTKDDPGAIISDCETLTGVKL